MKFIEKLAESPKLQFAMGPVVIFVLGLLTYGIYLLNT